MNNMELTQRYNLCLERIALIPDETLVKAPFDDFFRHQANFLIYLLELYPKLITQDIKSVSLDELKERNQKLYCELMPENYNRCYGNPDYISAVTGKDYGPLFSALYAELRGVITYIYEDRLWDIVVTLELFLECYCAFADGTPKPEVLKEILYMYNYDYCSDFTDRRIAELIDPSYDFAVKIIESAALDDIKYLYLYGEFISENEIGTAEFLNTLSEDEIDMLGSVIVEGYIKGFEATNKDITKKRTVNLRYFIGFEKIVRSAAKKFRAANLEPVIYRAASRGIDRRAYRIGYTGTSVNPQYEYDHRNDSGIWLDEKFITRRLACMREAFEKRKTLANTHGGPACIDTFGKEPFAPAVCEAAVKLTDEQQLLKRKYDSEAMQITNRYIIGEERSYTIIAFPIPAIGGAYRDIFRETVKINTLDNDLYQTVQQRIIDVLDEGRKVIIKGAIPNRTDLTVMLHELEDPSSQTNFENCTADANIPVGEVFTSPRLKGTNGVLHVSSVYLNSLNYKDLEIEIKDGMAAGYTCKNFENEEENRRYIKENIMFRYESLPMGEFAIGTNTAAYAMAEKFDIFQKLPILIAEKTGPHFAFGDTCYSFEEELVSFNPDGKAIVARENEISALRKKDPSKAYFGCHTDITIPYDELESICVIDEKGNEKYIIKNGRFVLDGTEILNTALD